MASQALASIGNFYGFSLTPGGSGNAQGFIRTGGGSTNPFHNLNNNIFPSSFQRAKVDLQTWAQALIEAEVAGWPFRVALQKMYEKTILNGHVASCIQRRKELTLLRDYEIVDASGNKDNTWTEYFKMSWFKHHALELTLDAQYHGFSLISIGEIKDGVPNLLTNVKRWNISPERKHVSIFEKSPAGYSWEDEPYDKWHVWVPTIQLNGINNCGYGLLLVASMLEILQRNNVAYNCDFIEMFAQPYRWLKTNDLEGEEYEEKKAALTNMGHMGALITGLSDELEFLNDGSRGNGYKAYNDFDHRAKSDISKWFGGHADFIDSTPKALGGSQNSGGGDITDDASGNTPVQKAIAAKRMIDGDFATAAVNEIWIPKLQGLGIAIPKGHKIHFLNDSEERSIAAQEADKNQKWGTLGLTLAQAGYRIEQATLEKLLDLKLEKVAVMPDKNVLKDPKEQVAGDEPLKDEDKKRIDKPKHTE
jgi:hypothetical protein